ncbi:hypothetical protein [Halobiforma nitratireducens]|uniref:DUF8001 domain-containing protein n=1 Tax=Halobiforma nitratireducens JCM 10879 TaxID=1227454 RepID=M0LPG4_9EURY|nr:hypothetical protein [Halobiforma nitratireducens]EMA35437.1 hypothetical protein C446_12609 [Halobiforma nitratireducens JCM 10879]
MGDTIYVDRKDLTSGQILEKLDSGNRVIIEVDVLGKTLRMALRRQQGTYYCDTPMKLLTFESQEEMQSCLERYRLARAEPAEETEEDVRPSAE